jgi:crotonobetainyl-CoA:carnitine CoA-transferase CaiB-like acyl-CoA transferase
MSPALNVWHGTGRIVERVGVRHNMIVPYGAYACADGDVMLAIQTDREWRRFCDEVMGDAQLADDARFVSNANRVAHREPLEAMIEAQFKRQPRAAVIARLEKADIPTAAINDVPAVAAHPQLAARQRWARVESANGSFQALVPPHNLRHAPPRMGRVPALGEHTQEILTELGRE